MASLPIRLDTRDPRPLWRQIEDELLRLIAAGDYAIGAPLPSVRDLARRLRVNPNTVARVYQRLGETGILGVRRGEGTYVLEPPPTLPARERARKTVELAGRYVAQTRALGATDEEIVGAVERTTQEVEEMRGPQ